MLVLRFLRKNSVTIFVLAFSIFLAGVFHGYNMFHYPYFENDEGIYLSQGYAVAYEGRLTNYTYWYDHTPVGWFLIALWLRITGGPFTFGTSVESARIFVFVLHIVSSILLYLTAKKLTGRNLIGFLAVLFFSTSPLITYYGRRLLLDNIMSMWMLVSIFLLAFSNKRLKLILLSGIAFGLAVMTKETAIITLPAYIYLVAKSLDKRQLFIGMTLFLLPVCIFVSNFLLYAYLKGELFPGSGHVSLLGTWGYQLSRGEQQQFWESGSDFRGALSDWVGKDFYFTYLLLSAPFILCLLAKHSFARGISLIAICVVLFFIRGGLVINFYISGLFAIGALTIALLFDRLTSNKILVSLLVMFVVTYEVVSFKTDSFVKAEIKPQKQALNWVRKNLPQESIIVVDHTNLIDLRIPKFSGDIVFPKADFFWKSETDPEIKDAVLENDWKNIDYIILSHEMTIQARFGYIKFLTPSLQYVKEIASFGPSSKETFVNVQKLISTNGDWVKIYKLLDRTEILLLGSWRQYKNRFITDSGQVIDPQSGFTTSEGQAYAMLRALIVDDRQTFDIVWNWTKSHMQFRNEDKLLSWKWQGDEKTGKLIDTAPAADADIDIATALILASDKWKNELYKTQAKEIIKYIWDHEVTRLGSGQYYLLPGPWAIYGDQITINPSYFSPAAFRLFAKVDSEHPWLRLAQDSYKLLSKFKTTFVLMPDWIGVDKRTEDFVKAKDLNLKDKTSYDAIRLYFRISQDALWFNSSQSKDFLSDNRKYVELWEKEKKISPEIDSRVGKSLVDYENNSLYGALLPYFRLQNEFYYQEIKQKLMNDFTNQAWIPEDSYYTQNWVWFGIALSEGKFVLSKKY